MDKDGEHHKRRFLIREIDSEQVISDMKERLQRLQAKEKYFMDKLKLRHKITFAFLVFFGINLLWYGMWGIVEEIPFLNNPIVSLIIGAIILVATGYFYENLISASFNKKTRKKKEAIKEEEDLSI
jgi:quinol-cytochrome oxidoreductase complex cytochrome b subunit